MDYLQDKIEGRELGHLYVNYRRSISEVLWAIQQGAARVKIPGKGSSELKDFDSGGIYCLMQYFLPFR